MIFIHNNFLFILETTPLKITNFKIFCVRKNLNIDTGLFWTTVFFPKKFS